MVVMTESRNEQRLDDLNSRVNDGFTELRAEIKAGDAQLRAEMNDGFSQLRTEMRAGDEQLRLEMREGFAELRGEIGGLQRTLLQVGGGLIGTVIAAATAISIALS